MKSKSTPRKPKIAAANVTDSIFSNARTRAREAKARLKAAQKAHKTAKKEFKTARKALKEAKKRIDTPRAKQASAPPIIRSAPAKKAQKKAPKARKQIISDAPATPVLCPASVSNSTSHGRLRPLTKAESASPQSARVATPKGLPVAPPEAAADHAKTGSGNTPRQTPALTPPPK